MGLPVIVGAGRNGCHPVRERTYGPRGVRLLDEYGRRSDESGNRGTYGGYQLYLTAQGYVELTREGTWSVWQGEWARYDATPAPLTGTAVAAQYDVDEVIAALAAAVEDAHAAKPDAGAHARRAERFRTLTALLRW